MGGLNRWISGMQCVDWSLTLVQQEWMMSTFRDRITLDPHVCHGKPTVRGLRYPVEMILDLLSSAMTTEAIMGDYPDLVREDILAVLGYAAHLSRVKRIDPVER
jgi:uncharacterized protein (DUF433 family)